MNSKKINKHSSVLVVAYDAGGAEVIAAYVRTHKQAKYFIYAAGPARRIFRRNGLSTKRAPETRKAVRVLMQKHKDAKFALIGTGWMTRIEWNALLEAKRAGMRTTAFLDSWINFREVFGYPKKNWRKNLPDEIWVGDNAGLMLAKRYFPHTHVRFEKNRYFADIISRYRIQERTVSRKERILFMSAAGETSERICADFLTAMSHRGISRTVRVRLHPADAPARYKKIIRRTSQGITVELSYGKTLVSDLLSADVVVGPETVALVPAFMLGLKTIRIVPRGEKAFLPFQGIRKVKSAEDAVRKIIVEPR
jgi:hypothetical protein